MTRVVIHMARIALVLRPLWLVGCQRDGSPSCTSSTYTRKYVESPNEVTESTEDKRRDMDEDVHGNDLLTVEASLEGESENGRLDRIENFLQAVI